MNSETVPEFSATAEIRGRIFDIQRYSIHDGPGIRTIVFLKGCRLRCRWCCNPESQEFGIQSMQDPSKPGETKTVGRDVTPDELLPELLRDLPYYRRSGGGVTLSGGEAMCQPRFAEALLRLLLDHGIDTAMETTGFAPAEELSRVIPLVNHVLMDIKHMESEKHRAFTGVPNEKILENARLIARLAKESAHELIIRVPVIPTFNDTAEEIRAISHFAAALPGVRRLHLLPYHRLGQDKYAALGRDYSLQALTPPTGERMAYLLEVAEESGLICQIGG